MICRDQVKEKTFDPHDHSDEAYLAAGMRPPGAQTHYPERPAVKRCDEPVADNSVYLDCMKPW